jgi:translation elongation factor EF-Tu-like GTPase
MGLWPFKGRSKDDRSVEALLAESNAASPTGQQPGAPATTGPVAPTGVGFTMPVEDVFMITGRGVVVTGKIATGTAAVGQPLSIVRNGAVIATSKLKGIEMFRAVMETATVGQNVGLLLDGMSRDQVNSGDVIQG